MDGPVIIKRGRSGDGRVRREKGTATHGVLLRMRWLGNTYRRTKTDLSRSASSRRRAPGRESRFGGLRRHCGVQAVPRRNPSVLGVLEDVELLRWQVALADEKASLAVRGFCHIEHQDRVARRADLQPYVAGAEPRWLDGFRLPTQRECPGVDEDVLEVAGEVVTTAPRRSVGALGDVVSAHNRSLATLPAREPDPVPARVAELDAAIESASTARSQEEHNGIKPANRTTRTQEKPMKPPSSSDNPSGYRQGALDPSTRRLSRLPGRCRVFVEGRRAIAGRRVDPRSELPVRTTLPRGGLPGVTGPPPEGGAIRPRDVLWSP